MEHLDAILESAERMANWIDIGPAADYPEGEHVCTRAAERSIVVFNVDGEFYAIANVCPHAGLPLGDGERRGHVITCPYHGYTYNIRNGRNVDWPHDEPPVRTYPVRREGDRVQVLLEQPKPARTTADDDNGNDKKNAPAPRGPAPDERPPGEPSPVDEPAEHVPDEEEKPPAPTGYPDRPPTKRHPQ